jgi:ribosomal protein L9
MDVHELNLRGLSDSDESENMAHKMKRKNKLKEAKLSFVRQMTDSHPTFGRVYSNQSETSDKKKDAKNGKKSKRKRESSAGQLDLTQPYMQHHVSQTNILVQAPDDPLS